MWNQGPSAANDCDADRDKEVMRKIASIYLQEQVVSLPDCLDDEPQACLSMLQQQTSHHALFIALAASYCHASAEYKTQTRP